jgi:hypothetical protein
VELELANVGALAGDEVAIGLGRIVALHDRSPAPYQIC